MQKLIEKIEGLGWVVDKEDEEYRMSRYSPAGQDFSFVVEAGEDTEAFIQNIKQAYDDYDVSEEAYLWLDDSGHGQRGAPYDMKDVYEDMEACEAMILELYQQLEES